MIPAVLALYASVGAACTVATDISKHVACQSLTKVLLDRDPEHDCDSIQRLQAGRCEQVSHLCRSRELQGRIRDALNDSECFGVSWMMGKMHEESVSHGVRGWGGVWRDSKDRDGSVMQLWGVLRCGWSTGTSHKCR